MSDIKVECLVLGMIPTNCYFVHKEDSGDGIFFDPADEGERIYSQLTQKGFTVKQILLTHAHFDHILGAYAFKDAIAIASRRFVDVDRTAALEEVQNFNDEYYIESPVLFPDITHVIEESETTLTIGKTKLIFFLTPGHESTHLSFVVMPLHLLVCGDYASDVEIPLIEHDSSEYLTTLELLESFIYEYEVKLLIPGHGHICDVRTEMIERLHLSYDYILALRAHKESDWSPSWQRTSFMGRLH